MSGHDIVSTTDELPSNFRFHTRMDLKSDKKAALLVQLLFVAVAAVMIAVALAFDLPLDSGWNTWVLVVVTVVSVLLYMAVHELTHGAFIRFLSRTRPKYSVRFPFLTTGSTAYFSRKDAAVVALAHTVVWGIVLVAMLIVAPADFFLTVYVLTVVNFAGSAGDYVQSYAFSKLPPTALIQDNGRETTAFVPA
ncbi:MAG: DUF3267 domain-containing protein [Rhodococcus sp. (in: high G+C Gram-positive bacteria)]|uniref:DUF3267 domain-containing protein n=1 Tax=Rhodococcus sp. TaxID=1831 RepID=UPI003BAFC589